MFKKASVTLPYYAGTKDSLAFLNTEEGNMHCSFSTEEGKVVAFEHIPENYPTTALLLYDSVEEYKECLKNLAPWFQEEFVTNWAETILGPLDYYLELGQG